jgi:hypothetical protein
MPRADGKHVTISSTMSFVRARTTHMHGINMHQNKLKLTLGCRLPQVTTNDLLQLQHEQGFSGFMTKTLRPSNRGQLQQTLQMHLYAIKTLFIFKDQALVAEWYTA